MEIYQAGLAGKIPEQPVSVDELELEAKSVLKTEAFDYVAGGAGSEDTMRRQPRGVPPLADRSATSSVTCRGAISASKSSV